MALGRALRRLRPRQDVACDVRHQPFGQPLGRLLGQHDPGVADLVDDAGQERVVVLDRGAATRQRATAWRAMARSRNARRRMAAVGASGRGPRAELIVSGH